MTFLSDDDLKKQSIAMCWGYEDLKIKERGKFTLDLNENGNLVLTVAAPIPSGEYNLKKLEWKKPPLRFDRTEKGEIILPFEVEMDFGFQAMDIFNQSGVIPESYFKFVEALGRAGVLLLPAGTPTIFLSLPDGEEGESVTYEALPSGSYVLKKLKGHYDEVVELVDREENPPKDIPPGKWQ